MLQFIPIFVTTVFLSLHVGALLYVNSSYLGQFFSNDSIAIIFIVSSIGNIILFLYTPRLLNRFSRDFLLFTSFFITIFSTLALAYSTSNIIAAVCFITYSSVVYLNYYLLDIYLEEISSNKKTGEIRGLYLTFLNAGIASGPLLISLVQADSAGLSVYRTVYLIGSLLLIIPLIFSLLFFKASSAVRKHRQPLELPFKRWWRNRDVRANTLARVVLEMFFAIMVVYTPIYLHTVIGFAWTELGLIFSVALLPFVIFEWPAGEIADRYLGEKELMSLGFFIAGCFLLVMPFLGKAFYVWMIVLFLSRVGASLIEVMSESYFFKKIDVEDSGILTIYRLSRPIGIILGTSIGALSLYLFSFEKIFFVLAVVVFFGLKESLYIRDTL